MAEEVVKTDDPKEEKPEFLTRAEMEAMLTAQQTQFAGMFNRLVETLTPKEPPKGDEGGHGKVVSFYDKPEEAANKLFEEKMAPMRDAYVAGEKVRQLNAVSLLPFAKDYINEIAQVVATATPLMQIQPGFAEQAYNLVIGRHRDEVFAKMKEADTKKPEFTETVTAGAPPAKESATLSSAEREAADGMGLTNEDYKKWRDNPEAMAAVAMNPTKKAS